MIEIQGITKHFGSKLALDNVSFTAPDGKVTGFLGPNGAGKSTTMKAALGLIKPDSGQALIDGKQYRTSDSPMAEVGAVLDAKSAHRGRSAYAHLRALALTNGISKQRVNEVIELTGLNSVKGKKAGAFSLGMGHRLSLAAALLGDPHNLVLDEPVNGLDPEGVKWIRELCRYYASQGRAVLLSSHLMSEVALTADNLVIIGQGHILEVTTVANFVGEHSRHAIRVVTPESGKLHAIFEHATGIEIQEIARESNDPDVGTVFRINGADLKAAARVFAQAQLITYELVEEHVSLEEAYLEFTHNQVEYTAKALPGSPADTGATGTTNATGTTRATGSTGSAGSAGLVAASTPSAAQPIPQAPATPLGGGVASAPLPTQLSTESDEAASTGAESSDGTATAAAATATTQDAYPHAPDLVPPELHVPHLHLQQPESPQESVADDDQASSQGGRQ